MTGPLPPKDDALLFFRDTVEPTVAEFLADRANKRRGCHACHSLADMTSHYFQARMGGRENACKAFKLAIRNENKAVGWIADAANATRHVVRSAKFDAIGYDDIQTMDGPMRRPALRLAHPWRRSARRPEARMASLIECAMDFWREKLGLGAPER